MVKTLLNIEETPQFYDATDALAAAICHSVRYNAASGNSSNWAEFIKNNPDIVVKH
jgi:crossover junction endodeoxyribonuclease RuvC